MRNIIKLAVLIVLLLPSLSAIAQTNGRIVKGVIIDEGGKPFPSAVIVSDDGSEFEPAQDGSFSIQVSSHCRYLTFSAPFYHDVKMEIDGSFLYVKMIEDKEAREKAEKARLGKEEKERLEEEARIKAEETARQKVVRDSLAAEVKAQIEANRRKKDADYDDLFVNKGFTHSIRMSYANQLDKCVIVYQYSGYREYGSLLPFLFDYSLSYMINRLFSVGIGAGVLFNAKSISIVGDEFASLDFKETRLDVPMFATMAAHFGRWKTRPSIAISGGYYLLSNVVLIEGAIGVEFRIENSRSIELDAFVKSIPYPFVDQEQGIGYYKIAISPGVAVCFNF